MAPENKDDYATLKSMGQTVVSFRQLVKRYCRERVTGQIYSPPNCSSTYVSFIPNFFPAVGRISKDNFATTGCAYYNGVIQTHLSYLSYGFLGHKGSTRIKVVPHIGASAAGQPHRIATTVRHAFTNIWAQEKVNGSHPTLEGAALVGDLLSGDGIELEIPDYRTTTFSVNWRQYNGEQYNGVFIHTLGPSGTASVISELPYIYDVHRAAGEDFTFLWYIGPPTLRWQTFTQNSQP